MKKNVLIGIESLTTQNLHLTKFRINLQIN